MRRGGGGVAPGPGEGEGDHGQHVLVLQLVKHGKPDVLRRRIWRRGRGRRGKIARGRGRWRGRRRGGAPFPRPSSPCP